MFLNTFYYKVCSLGDFHGVWARLWQLANLSECFSGKSPFFTEKLSKSLNLENKRDAAMVPSRHNGVFGGTFGGDNSLVRKCSVTDADV